MTKIRLALFQPDIAQNTGTILRIGACLGIGVDVIGPTGFDMTDRALKRAALDYLAHVEIARYEDWSAFLAAVSGSGRRLVLGSTHATHAYFDFSFHNNDVILLGRESTGVPDSVRQAVSAHVCIPVRADMRSLNVAVAAGILAAEALRQVDGFPR